MLYGRYNENGSKIGADPPVDEVWALRCRYNTMAKYRDLASFDRPHLDVGSGIDFARRDMPGAVTCDVDLDVDRFPYEDDTFKTVTSFEVLEHLYNPLYHVLEVRRVLHPEGRLYLTTPDDWSFIYRLEHFRLRKYAAHFHQFTEFDLRQLMARGGMKIVHLERFRRGGSGTLARLSKNLFFVICEPSH